MKQIQDKSYCAFKLSNKSIARSFKLFLIKKNGKRIKLKKGKDFAIDKNDPSCFHFTKPLDFGDSLSYPY